MGRRKRAELPGLMRPAFARTGPWVQAGRYAGAVMSDLPKRNGWTIARHVGDRTPDRTQRLKHYAAIAICRGRGDALATRNVSDFDGTGVKLIDPWRQSPG